MLQDVLLNEGLQDKDALIYDIGLSKWVNKPISDVITAFVGTNGSSDGKAGLVPAPSIEHANMFLRSDGTWAEIVVAGSSLILQVVAGSNESHIEAIDRIVKGQNITKGNIVIVKELIANDIFQHSSYIYDGSAWVAMDCNYNAENIYFDEDFVFTEQIGTVIIPESGNVTVNATGKNLKQFLTDLFAVERDPEIAQPTAAIKLKSATKAEVGTTYIPKYEINFTRGKYSYGPDTDIIASYEVNDSRGLFNSSAIGEFESFIINDDTDYKITATVNHTKGEIPVSNFGNPVESKRIESNDIYLESESVIGYRNAFFGALNHKNEITSDLIRSLNKSNDNVQAGSSFTINIPVDTLRVIIAYDAKLKDLDSVFDKNDSGTNIVSGFSEPRIMQVEGAENHVAINYKVFIMDFANPYNTANVFTAII